MVYSVLDHASKKKYYSIFLIDGFSFPSKGKQVVVS